MGGQRWQWRAQGGGVVPKGRGARVPPCEWRLAFWQSTHIFDPVTCAACSLGSSASAWMHHAYSPSTTMSPSSYAAEAGQPGVRAVRRGSTRLTIADNLAFLRAGQLAGGGRLPARIFRTCAGGKWRQPSRAGGQPAPSHSPPPRALADASISLSPRAPLSDGAGAGAGRPVEPGGRGSANRTRLTWWHGGGTHQRCSYVRIVRKPCGQCDCTGELGCGRSVSESDRKSRLEGRETRERS